MSDINLKRYDGGEMNLNENDQYATQYRENKSRFRYLCPQAIAGLHQARVVHHRVYKKQFQSNAKKLPSSFIKLGSKSVINCLSLP